MSNFNIKKFLTENKLTAASRRTNESQSVKTENVDFKKLILHFEKRYPEFDPYYDGMGTFTLSLDYDVDYFINIHGETGSDIKNPKFDIEFYDEVKNKNKKLGTSLDYKSVIRTIERFISKPQIKKLIGESPPIP